MPGVDAVDGPVHGLRSRSTASRSNQTIDTLNGVEARLLRLVYRPKWLRGGSDALLGRLRGDTALIEEQFAKTHGIAVGERFRDRDAVGRQGDADGDRRVPRPADPPGDHRRPADLPARLRARTTRSRSSSRPIPAPTAARCRRDRRRARPLPDRRGALQPAVPRPHQRAGQPDRLPALRAAGDEPRDLAVRDRQQPVPGGPRAHARVRAAARRRRHAAPGAARRALRERDHRDHRRAARDRRSASCSPRWPPPR